jgi:hypothetical protein
MTLATNLPNPLKKGNPILNQLKQLAKKGDLTQFHLQDLENKEGVETLKIEP